MLNRQKLKTKIYPVPSWRDRQAYVCRATLPSKFDLTFGEKNARYPTTVAEISKNPFLARKLAIESANAKARSRSFEESAGNQARSETLTLLLEQDQLRRTLLGQDAMVPVLENQKFWAHKLSPEIALNEAESVWSNLIRFNIPLLRQLATPAQNAGIDVLRLNSPVPTSFEDLEEILNKVSGWKIEPTAGEVPPEQFFSLLSKTTFPVVPELRPLNALFCGYQPDFWHEVMGHLTFLTNPDFSQFYQYCGNLVTTVAGEKSKTNELYQVLWTLMEYGIFKSKDGSLVPFGSALTSSFMALQRLKNGFIVTRPFEPEIIVRTGFAVEGPILRRQGKIEFFHIESLDHARLKLETWLSKRPLNRTTHQE